MNIVNEETKHTKMKIQDLNIDVLHRAKTYFIRKYNLTQIKKPNIQSLTRDQKIFGNRENNSMSLLPEIDPYNKKNENEQNKEYLMERLVSERDAEIGIKKEVPINKLGEQINEKAPPIDDFLKQLQTLEMERKKVDENFDFQQNRMQLSKEMIEFNTLEKQNDARKALYTSIKNEQPAILSNDKFSEGKEFAVIPRNIKQKNIEKYLSVNSYDRDLSSNPNRYNYSVYFTQNRYRNIESLAVSKFIMPDEIVQINDPIKTSFNFEYTFAYPYLILQINEFDDVYDGTNNIIRKAFCKLVFDKAYKAQNGRGYVILKPIQHEKKTFYPAPLSGFTKLSINLLKPNGELYNSSTDNYNILQITYDIANPQYLLITTNLYFEQNEFYLNDYVILNNFLMTNISGLQAQLDIKSFNDYINNINGYQIQKLGTPNANGYYNSFYIQAPGNFDRTLGQFVINNTLITCLNNYNTALVTPVINGSIINYSLQHSISMKINLIVDDASSLTTSAQSHFNL
jgi:hypothetical protein